IEQMQRENLIKEEWEALKRDKETAELELKKERLEKEKILRNFISYLSSSGVRIGVIATQLNIPESEILWSVPPSGPDRAESPR
ncbi:MAG: hypothetical protein MUF42_04055, partial [Cytophagaceae bacterium]|nr:hypothetical protein [Cytophagaceae bacterium]